MATYNALSRYRLDATGQTASRLPVQKYTYNIYTVRDGDTLETIAARILGNPLRYWEIADMNPQVKFPLDLEAGMPLRMPL